MKRPSLRVVSRTLWRPVKLLLEALLPCAIGACIYLLYSSSALPLLMYVLSDLTHGEVRVSAASGSLGGPAALDGFVYDTPLMRLEIRHADLVWKPYGVLSRHLAVTELRATRVLLTIKPHVHTGPDTGALTQLPWPLKVEMLHADSFELYVHDAAPVVFSDVDLVADWHGDVIETRPLTLTYAPIGRIALDGRLRLQPHALEVIEAQLSGPATAQVQGLIGYDNSVRLDAAWTRLQWPFSGVAQVDSASGRLHMNGNWQSYDWNLAGPVRVQLQPQPVSAELRAHGHGTLHGLQVQEAALRGLGGALTAQADLAWLPKFSLSVNGKASCLNPAANWKEWPGSLAGNFAFDLQPAADGVRAQFDAALADSTLRDFGFALNLRGTYAAKVLTLAQFDLHSGASLLKLQGRATPPFDLSAQLDSPDLANLWPQLLGSAQLQGTLTGTEPEPHITLRGQLHNAQYRTLALEQADLDADISPRLPSHIDLKATKLKAGILMPLLTLHADGTAAAHQLKLNAQTQAGNLDVALRGALDLAARRWRGQLYDSHGAPLRLSPWMLEEPAALEAAPGFVQLDPVCWKSSAARACTQFALRGTNARLAFRLQDWAFAYFEPFLPPQWTLAGKASGTGVLIYDEGKLHAARGDVETEGGALNVEKHPALVFKASTLRISDEDSGTQAQLHMPLDNGGIEVDATLAPAMADGARALSGHVGVDVGDLTPLRLLSPQVESVSGQVHGDFKLGGTATQPLAEGVLQLADGRVRLGAPGIEVTALKAMLKGSSASPVISLEASGESGGGALALTGSINPRDAQQRLQFKLSGHDFQVMNTTQVRVWASPDLQFTAGDDHAELHGEVQVPRAEIRPKSLTQGVGPSRDQIILGPEEQLPAASVFKVISQVRIALGESVSFEGYGLKALLRGAIDTSDEPGRPTQARGEITLAEGRYKAYGQDLTIENGRLLFDGGLITQPAVEVRAVRNNTSEITVGVLVRGTLAAPQLTLFSSPDMPPEQQLSWLILGHGAEEQPNASERGSLSSAALSLGMSGGSYLTQKIGGTLGLDEVSVSSKPGQTSDQAQFTLGKYLSPRLYISYGVGLFQPGHTFRLLYDISKHFKLSTETGVESGGDILYTTDR